MNNFIPIQVPQRSLSLCTKTKIKCHISLKIPRSQLYRITKLLFMLRRKEMVNILGTSQTLRTIYCKQIKLHNFSYFEMTFAHFKHEDK